MVLILRRRIGMQLRDLPSVDAVLATGALRSLAQRYRRDWLVELVRHRINEARNAARKGEVPPGLDDIVQSVVERARTINSSIPGTVINATGVIIHTNLGRAPLSQDSITAMTAVAGYSDLELDLTDGRRGSRQAHLQPILRYITGAEAGIVVNNNASALLLGLSAIAHGKEVIVSRGEEVEIGGGFRIPGSERRDLSGGWYY
jgi:L-seryl-tRNA(Ser) seleniumtransferase